MLGTQWPPRRPARITGIGRRLLTRPPASLGAVNARIAIVAGAGGGLGQATAVALHKAGYATVAVDRNDSGLSTLPEGIHRKVGDVTDPSVPGPLVDEIVREGKFASVGDRIVIVAGSSLGTPHMLNGVLIHTIGGEPEHLSEGAPPMVQTEEET